MTKIDDQEFIMNSSPEMWEMEKKSNEEFFAKHDPAFLKMMKDIQKKNAEKTDGVD
jgi:hypothetical protein